MGKMKITPSKMTVKELKANLGKKKVTFPPWCKKKLLVALLTKALKPTNQRHTTGQYLAVGIDQGQGNDATESGDDSGSNDEDAPQDQEFTGKGRPRRRP